MDNFLETMHPYILSEDSTLQNFALTTIAKAYLGNDTTFELALKVSKN